MKLTISIILICIFVFGLQSAGIVTNQLAFMPAEVASKPYTIITSIFMHGNLRHLMLNMVGLFIFGSIVENEVGSKNWILIYLFSGFIGSLGYMLLADTFFIPALGASGAVFGLMGAAAISKPTQVIYTPYGPFPMIIAAIIWGITEIISSFGVGTVAHSAHFFGLIGGGFFVLLDKKNIDFKINSVFLIIPIVAILLLGTTSPSEIPGFQPTIENCNITNQIEEINFKYYHYFCDEGTVVIRAMPEVAELEPARYNEYFPRITSQIYYEFANNKCEVSENEIDIDRDTGLISNWGNICEYNYLNFALKCENVKYEIVQIYEDNPFLDYISCEYIQKHI